MNNISKLTIRKTTVALLTTLLLIAIAAPLISLASAAPTASLSVSSGPLGTAITVSGSGFGASESAAGGTLFVSVNGQAAGKNVITTSTVAAAGVNPAVTLAGANALQTSATGVLSGKIFLFNDPSTTDLAVGSVNTIIIYDATTSVIAGTFTITAPSVTVTPSTVAAGASVTVSGSGFPAATGIYTNKIDAASFAGTAITVAAGATTANPLQLSKGTLTSGAVTATVSLPGITTGSAFTLTDAWDNVATTTLSLGTPTVTLSPSSGPVGTVVTATLTGFGSTATITTVAVGNIAATTSAATVAPPTTITEQGTGAFVFTMPAGDTTTKAGVAGAQTVKVTDSLGNVATATFTVTQKVALTLGAGGVDSQTTFAPANTANGQVFITASGFKSSTELAFTASPLIPAAWITPSATWGVTTGTYSAITGKVSTDANGQVVIASDQATTPASAGQYSITISDGTNTVSTIVTITTSGSIIAARNAFGTSSGAIGSGVMVIYFGAVTPATIQFDTTNVATPVAGSAQVWPTATLGVNTVNFVVPATTSGLHQIKSSTAGFNSVPYTVLAPTITVVSPSTASVGTTVTVVGTGFSGATATLAIQGASVTAATDDLAGDTLIATFTVPNYLPGSYTLELSDGTNSASSTFNVAAAQIQITPTSGTPTNSLGAAYTIAITGSGFKAGDTFTVKFDTTTITAAAHTGLSVINNDGAMLINSGFAIPTSTTAGAHTIYVIGATGAYATATYTIQPKLDPIAAVRPGAKITVGGEGFAANSLQSLSLDGVSTLWRNTATTPSTTIVQTLVVTGATGDLYSTVGFDVPATQVPGPIEVTVTDAAGNVASTTLTVLATPAITLGSANIVAGNIITGVSIAGSGFTPGATAFTGSLYDGSTLIGAVTMIGSPVTVGGTGSFAATAGLKFKVAAGTPEGDYTLRVTGAVTETADAPIHVLGVPTLTAPTTAASGSKVDITVTGISKITDATFSTTALVTASVIQTVGGADQFGGITMTSEFTKDTWFIVPTGLFAGTYLLTLQDSNTGLQVQQAITVTPTIAVTPTTGIKGAVITVTGTGFAATSALTATVNGQAVTLSAATTTGTGGITATFNLPITATATNTLTLTDAAGNTASATVTLTVPTITLSPTTAAVGSTVQILGSGFTATSTIVVQVGGQIVTTTPANLQTSAAGAFIAYISVPSGLSGNVTITATDTSNNVATAYLDVTTSSGGSSVPSQTTMTSTAQTTTPSGTATTTFTAGSTVKASFVLQTSGTARDVVVAVTWQQGAQVYGMATLQTTMDSTARTMSFSQLLPAGVTGTWTGTLQVFAIDGVTPLGVATLTFTVS